MLGGGVPLMSTPPWRCYARHTCSLYGGTWIEMPASFVMAYCQRGPCVSVAEYDYWLLDIDRYRSGRIGIGGDTQTDISYSPMLQRNEWVLTDMLYRSNTKSYEYSTSQSNLPHCCGNSHAIWDHTVLPAIWQRWHSRGWQVILCDPIWHVSSRIGEASRELLYSVYFTLLTFLYPSWSWYSIKRPRSDARLSWPSWLVTYRDGIPTRRRSPIQVLPAPMCVNFVYATNSANHYALTLTYS